MLVHLVVVSRDNTELVISAVGVLTIAQPMQSVFVRGVLGRDVRRLPAFVVRKVGGTVLDVGLPMQSEVEDYVPHLDVGSRGSTDVPRDSAGVLDADHPTRQ